MQATATDKLQYYLSIFLVNACLLALIWSVSPISFLKPDTTVYAAPVVQVKKTIKQILSGKPTRIVLAGIAIDLPVVDGIYNPSNGEWTIASREAFYATPTVPVNNDSGSTLIYGHNNRKTLWNLRNIVPGTELLVYTDNGYIFHYTYQSALEVQPTDTSLLTNSGPPKVILQTCSGNWNEYRKMFQFDLKSIEKS